MPYPRTHQLITFIGDAFTGQEIWQTSVRIDSSTAPTETELEGYATAYANFHAASGAGIGNAVRFLAVKGALIDASGHYPNDFEASEYVRPTPLVGGGPGIGIPQLSTVLTLNTTRSRGLGSVGRMFPPSTAFSPQPDGRMSTGTAQGLADLGATLISDINAAAPGNVTVFGQTGSGTAFEVTGVRVGRVIDTQRRRRNGLAEDYLESTLGN